MERALHTNICRLTGWEISLLVIKNKDTPEEKDKNELPSLTLRSKIQEFHLLKEGVPMNLEKPGGIGLIPTTLL